jgi:hypothetical protein
MVCGTTYSPFVVYHLFYTENQHKKTTKPINFINMQNRNLFFRINLPFSIIAIAISILCTHKGWLLSMSLSYFTTNIINYFIDRDQEKHGTKSNYTLTKTWYFAQGLFMPCSVFAILVVTICGNNPILWRIGIGLFITSGFSLIVALLSTKRNKNENT